ncbi:MAG: hypothetical protein KJ808_05220 [Acidobacteria bacterium]|nr:hypothetical protein [Acidobacteriota bacterium]MBU4307316.1 hypothetical protein [Acidobacteriota bacterium]MCG2811715.1 DUF6125 family protein [Candidatus Aminicenantes bacterium]
MIKADRIGELSREELLQLTQVYAKNWLAHDGSWFLSIEEKYGLAKTIEIDIESWRKFTVIEAARLIEFLQLGKNSGVSGLKKALAFRLYASLNEDEIVLIDKNTLEYRVKTCRVQQARRRKKLADFPCQPVGLVEYGLFASAIDAAFHTEVVSCPPHVTRPDHYCIWRFRLGD